MGNLIDKLSNSLGGGPLRRDVDPNVIGEIWDQSGWSLLGIAFGRFKDPSPVLVGFREWARGIQMRRNGFGAGGVTLHMSDEEIDQGIAVLRQLCDQGKSGVWKRPTTANLLGIPLHFKWRFGFRKFHGEPGPDQEVTISFAMYWLFLGGIYWFRLKRSQVEQFAEYLLKVKEMTEEPPKDDAHDHDGDIGA